MREQIIEDIKRELAGIVEEGTEIIVETVVKNNGVQLLGVNLRKAGHAVVPTVYIDEKIEEIEDGAKTAAEVAEWILETHEDALIDDGSVVEKIRSKEYILENVTYQVINKGRNAGRLETALHKELLDLAVVYRVAVIADNDGIGSFVIPNGHIEKCGISFAELDEAAERNTRENIVVKTMRQVMAAMFGMPEEEMPDDGAPMYVLTNRDSINGAASMLCIDSFE